MNAAASLLAEIDTLCKELGCSFLGGVEKFRVRLGNDESDEEYWKERFKKYRQRVGKSSGKPFSELSRLRDFLQKEVNNGVVVYPQPLLELVKDDPVCREMESISKRIRKQVGKELPDDGSCDGEPF